MTSMVLTKAKLVQKYILHKLTSSEAHSPTDPPLEFVPEVDPACKMLRTSKFLQTCPIKPQTLVHGI